MEHLVARVAPILDRDKIPYRRWTAIGLYRSVVMAVALMRQNLTQQTAADIFDVSQATVSRRFDQLHRAIREATDDYRPDLTRWRGSVIVDGTLGLIWDWAANPHLYSAKRHDHGFNIQIAVSLDGDIIAVGDPIDGARHDAYAYTASGLAGRLAHLHVVGDLGYLGHDVLTGTRKPPNGELNDHDSAFNTQLAKIRSAVERGISWFKNWKMISGRYRGPLHKYAAILQTITNLHHYRFQHPRE